VEGLNSHSFSSLSGISVKYNNANSLLLMPLYGIVIRHRCPETVEGLNSHSFSSPSSISVKSNNANSLLLIPLYGIVIRHRRPETVKSLNSHSFSSLYGISGLGIPEASQPFLILRV